MTLKVAEENGKCRTSLRCMDPDSETWFQDLVDFLVPDDAAGDADNDVHPLPELPSPGAAKEPLPAATPPAPTPAPAPVDKDLPYVPKREGVLRDWKAIWKQIKRLVFEGKSCAFIEGWLVKDDNDHQVTKRTIAKIIKAGEAGLLE